MLPKKARGTSRKHVIKPFTQPATPDCSYWRFFLPSPLWKYQIVDCGGGGKTVLGKLLRSQAWHFVKCRFAYRFWWVEPWSIPVLEYLQCIPLERSTDVRSIFGGTEWTFSGSYWMWGHSTWKFIFFDITVLACMDSLLLCSSVYPHKMPKIDI